MTDKHLPRVPGFESGVLYEIAVPGAQLVRGRGNSRRVVGCAARVDQWPMKESGFTWRPLRSTSKCTCGPVERPLEPMSATDSPRFTIWPTATSVRGSWAERV